MEKAIKKAIEAGFNYNKPISFVDSPFLDLEFWKCLDKACGWGKCDNPDHGFIGAMPGEINRLGCPVCGHDPDKIIDPDAWKYHWHDFIDHLAEGKDAESFFEELLK